MEKFSLLFLAAQKHNKLIALFLVSQEFYENILVEKGFKFSNFENHACDLI